MKLKIFRAKTHDRDVEIAFTPETELDVEALEFRQEVLESSARLPLAEP